MNSTVSMNILLIYYSWEKKNRSTIDESIRAFENYSDHKLFYLNYAFGVPSFLKNRKFDLIIYHYSIFALKMQEKRSLLDDTGFAILASLKGCKIAMPQDEYIYNDLICRFYRKQGIETVYTCFFETDYQKAYPESLSGLKNYFTVFPGYVDERALDNIKEFVLPIQDRHIDLGYRARKNPYWLGSLGVLKWKVTEVFGKYSGMIRMDVSNDPSKVFLGDEWYNFLASCRCVLGVESGSSLMDFYGDLRPKIEKYQTENPMADFSEVETAVFPNLDNNICLATVSPRHFEACMTKTCQVLVEGNYAGVFKPGLHYIEVKKDWSNVPEVIEKIKDPIYCEQIAERAYQDIILSGNYTYRKFVQEVLDFAQTQISEPAPENAKMFRLLEWREKYPYLFHPFLYAYTGIKSYAKLYLLRKGWLKFFIK